MALRPKVYHHRYVFHPIHSVARDIRYLPGDAAVGKSSLLIRLTDQRFLANPDPTVRPITISCYTAPILPPKFTCPRGLRVVCEIPEGLSLTMLVPS